MHIEAQLTGDKKLMSLLTNLWGTLTKTKAFTVPTTNDELAKFRPFHPTVVVASITYFFTDNARTSLRNAIASIHDKVRLYVSYAAVYRAFLAEIERCLTLEVAKQKKPPAADALRAVFRRLEGQQKHYRFIYVVKGIKLDGLTEVPFGVCRLVNFDAAAKQQIEDKTRANDGAFYPQSVEPFIDKHLMGRVCLCSTAFGEVERAREIAAQKAEAVISYLRLLIATLVPGAMFENRLKISVAHEAFSERERLMFINEDDGSASLSSGLGNTTFETVPINAKRIAELKDNLFLDDFVQMLDSASPTEFEGVILTALHWIGEAQNDYSPESAFLKCWTAIECFFSKGKTDITDKVTTGSAVLSCGSNFQFVRREEIKDYRRRLKELYDIRSQITHRGLKDCVKAADLEEVFRAATRCLTVAMELHQVQVQNLDQFERRWQQWRKVFRGPLGEHAHWIADAWDNLARRWRKLRGR